MLYFINKFIKLKHLTTCRVHFTRSSASLRKKSILDLVENLPLEPDSTGILHSTILEPKMTHVYVEVLGSGAEGVPACVAVKTVEGNFLLNCGEGTQKLASEYKFKLSRSPNIFITYPSWRNVSGLLGTMLTLQDNKTPTVNIHGDKCIEGIFSVVNKFANLRTLQAKVMNCSNGEEYKAGSTTVKYICLHPSTMEIGNKNPELAIDEALENSGSECESEVNSKRGSTSYSSKSEFEENLYGKKHKKKTRTVTGSHEKYLMMQAKLKMPAICFVFSTESTPGALNFEKCIDLGVPPGPLLGDLKNGKDVTLENGTVVKSEEVKEPDVPGVNIVVLECPSEEYLDPLVNEPRFCEYQSGDLAADAVIHFSNSEIVKTLKYQNWIKCFPQTTKHLFINEENKQTGSVAIHRQQYKLNLLDPVLFPLLPDAGIPDYPRKDNCVTDKGHTLVTGKPDKDIQIYKDRMFYKCDTSNFIKGETMCQLYLKPKGDYDYSKCLTLKKDAFLEEVYQADIKEKIETCRKELQELSCKLESDKRIYPKIVFLGTGSGKPSKVRNASGILVFVAEDKSIMLDCGENTYNQLISFYGKKRTLEILRNLKAIFISHLHADHHFGLITILKKRRKAFDALNETVEESKKVKFEPVAVFAPVQITRWLQLFADNFEPISDLYDLIGNSFLDQPPDNLKHVIQNAIKNLNLKNILTVPVCHCPHSFGVSIIHKTGWKVTYSGDTRPCEDLIRIGINSDILIHEATFGDSYKLHAKKKLHSTSYEAIDVGKRMRAKYILLTHFSQRYCYIPNIEEDFPHLNIGLAFDFMEVPFNRLPILPSLLIPLQYVLAKYDERVKATLKNLEVKREKMRNLHGSRRDHSPAADEKPAKISKIDFKDFKLRTSL